MTPLQRGAYDEGFRLVVDAFTAREPLQADAAVGWINECLGRSRNEEALQVTSRDAAGDMTAIRTFKASSSELAGYRLAGVIFAVEHARALLDRRGAYLVAPGAALPA